MHSSSAMGAGMGQILVRLLHNVFSLALIFKFHSAKRNLRLSSCRLPFLHWYQCCPVSSDSASKLIGVIIPRRVFSLRHPSPLSSTCTPTHHFPCMAAGRSGIYIICSSSAVSRPRATQPLALLGDRSTSPPFYPHRPAYASYAS